MYQNGRMGDEVKKRIKSPAKSGRVGISGLLSLKGILHFLIHFDSSIYKHVYEKLYSLQL